MKVDKIIEVPIKAKKEKKLKEHLNCIERSRIISLEFDEAANADCEDNRYGCTCINYEMCCGCIIQ